MKLGRIFKVLVIMVFTGMFFIPGLSWSLSVSITDAVAQSVGSSTITGINASPIVNSNAIQVTIDTSAGSKSIIVPQTQMKATLDALQDPSVTGQHNAQTSKNIINSNAVLAQFVAPTNNVPNLALTPNVSSTVVATLTSANAQASQ